MFPEVPIPEPFMFNPFKHHIEYAHELFRLYQPNDELKLTDVFGRGNNLLCDYYFGSLSTIGICHEVAHTLIQKGKYDEASYKAWIKEQTKKFSNVTLSDGSTWTLLVGREADKYIHIHPARYSRHAVRVRLLALKSAMLYRVFYPNEQTIDYAAINQLRAAYLQAPPIKDGSDVSNIGKVLKLFH